MKTPSNLHEKLKRFDSYDYIFRANQLFQSFRVGTENRRKEVLPWFWQETAKSKKNFGDTNKNPSSGLTAMFNADDF